MQKNVRFPLVRKAVHFKMRGCFKGFLFIYLFYFFLFFFFLLLLLLLFKCRFVSVVVVVSLKKSKKEIKDVSVFRNTHAK